MRTKTSIKLFRDENLMKNTFVFQKGWLMELFFGKFENLFFPVNNEIKLPLKDFKKLDFEINEGISKKLEI